MSIDTIVQCIGWAVLVSGGVLLAAIIVAVCVVRGTQKLAWANRNRAGFMEFLRWKAGVPPRGDRDAVILARMVARMCKQHKGYTGARWELDALDRWRYVKLPGEEAADGETH